MQVRPRSKRLLQAPKWDPLTLQPEIILLATNDTFLGAPDGFAVLGDGSVVAATGATNTVMHVSCSQLVQVGISYAFWYSLGGGPVCYNKRRRKSHHCNKHSSHLSNFHQLVSGL